MTKLEEVVIRTPDRRLQEAIDDLTSAFNQGRIGFSFTNTAPTDSPDDYEIRVFNSGSTYRIYVYFVGVGWYYVNLSS